MRSWLRRYVAVSVVAAVAAIIVGCEDSDSSPTGAGTGTGVAGDWQARGGGFTSTMHVDVSGNSVSGTVVFDGDSSPLTGRVDGNRVTLRSFETSGTGTLDGNTMTGSYVRDNGDRGSWTATRM